MPSIRSLFHPDLPIDRPIEKVIKFDNTQPEVLANESREYIVTNNLLQHYRKILRDFDIAQRGETGAECCVWLSGFYGSGKSSFAKYFGLCFNPDQLAGDGPFSDSFIKQFPDSDFQTEFKRVKNDYDVSVFLIDLSAQGTAGAPNTPISTLIYDRVCSWAGFPREAKIAQLEMKLSLDNKLDEYRQRVTESAGMPYEELLHMPALLSNNASKIAHEIYPELWPNEDSLAVTIVISTQTEEERMEQMLQLIEQKTGTKRVLFILDEVGHFLSNNQTLIGNLDGFAKNLKTIGEGKSWVIATAQQTLPTSGPMFHLFDRFPIKIDLTPSDIREITHRRLLKKSENGVTQLKSYFTNHGQQLTLTSEIEDYPTECDLNENTFVDFYPMLPQQFDILIEAIRSLARLQGGIGLRSAIRCVQDILIGANPDQEAIVDRAAPSLVTVADLYDILKSEILQVARDSILTVDRISKTYGPNSCEHKIAKAIALLQQVGNFPTNPHNLSALLYPSVGADSIADDIKTAINTLIEAPTIPIGETNGIIEFLSETITTIERDRDTIIVTSINIKALQNSLLREIFQKPPTAIIYNAKTVSAGIRSIDDGRVLKITEDKFDINFVIHFVPNEDLETTKDHLNIESLGLDNKNNIYIAAPKPPEIDGLLDSIYRSQEIIKQHQNTAESEVKRYVDNQEQLIITKTAEAQEFISQAITKGWFIFQGSPSAAATQGNNRDTMMNKQLSEAANKIFEKFPYANKNVDQKVAELFLRTQDLAQITAERDPLGLVNLQGSETDIKLDHDALKEILDFLDRDHNPDGKRLLNAFLRPPYGWNKDTTRYLMAALFFAQKLTITKDATEVNVIGKISLEAFKNNNSFNQISIKKNVTEIPTEVRQRAASRLTAITGKVVTALPNEIAKVTNNNLPGWQKEFVSLEQQCSEYGISTDRVTQLKHDLANIALGDGSDAPAIFGSEESTLHENIQWALDLKKYLPDAKPHLIAINEFLTGSEGLRRQGFLPDLPATIQDAAPETLAAIKNGTFYEDLPALVETSKKLKDIVSECCAGEIATRKSELEKQIEAVRESTDFSKLEEAKRNAFDDQLSQLIFECEPTIQAIESTPVQLLQLNKNLVDIRENIRNSCTTSPPPEGGARVSLPSQVTTESDLDKVVADLESKRSKLPIHITTD